MDDIIEFIFELLLELGIEGVTSKKAPKWIKYPAIALIALFFIFVFVTLFVMGIGALKNTILGGLFILMMDTVLVYLAIKKYMFKEK